MSKKSFDSIAKSYAFLESFLFGDRLQEARTFALSQSKQEIKTALVIGDGNGSFAIELLKTHPNCKIDSIDISTKMLEVSKQRITDVFGSEQQNLNTILCDATHFDLPNNHYDFIGLHFILDCFDSEQCKRLLEKTSNALKETGILSYADFEIPTQQPNRLVSTGFIRLLYLVFRMITGLETQSLPQIEWPETLKPIQAHSQLGGLLISRSFKK